MARQAGSQATHFKIQWGVVALYLRPSLLTSASTSSDRSQALTPAQHQSQGFTALNGSNYKYLGGQVGRLICMIGAAVVHATSHNRPSAGWVWLLCHCNQSPVVSCVGPTRPSAEDDAPVSLSVRAEPYSPQHGPGRLSRAPIGPLLSNTRLWLVTASWAPTLQVQTASQLSVGVGIPESEVVWSWRPC